MDPTLLQIAADLLDLAADTFSNHGCNDFKMGRFSEADRTTLAALMNRANYGKRDLSTVDPDDLMTAERLKDWAQDWILMQALAHGLREQADEWEADAREQEREAQADAQSY